MIGNDIVSNTNKSLYRQDPIVNCHELRQEFVDTKFANRTDIGDVAGQDEGLNFGNQALITRTDGAPRGQYAILLHVHAGM